MGFLNIDKPGKGDEGEKERKEVGGKKKYRDL